MPQLTRFLGTRWQGVAEEHRSILRSLVTVAGLAFIGKLAGAAKEMAVAWRYGISAEVDAYLFVYNLVSWPLSIWFGVLTVILIPMAARMRVDAPDELPRFRSEILGFTLLIGCVLAGVGLIALPSLLSSAWVGLPARTASLAVQMVPVLAWVVIPGLLAGLYSTWMMSRGGNANTLFEGLPALGILTGVLLGGGIGPLIWGTLAGTIAQLAFVAAPMQAREERHTPSFRLASPQWPLFWQAFGVMILGQAIMSLTTIVDQFFAARLGEGSISSMGFANRIISLLLGIIATAVTRATLPVFSRTGASGVRDLRGLALRWAGVMGLIGCTVVAVGWLVAPLVVRLLFQRGTFTSEDTVRVAELLRYGLLQLPFYFSSLVLVSMHASLGRYRLLLLSGIVGLCAKVVASFLLLPAYGVVGLMLTYVAVYACNTLLLARVNPR